MSIRFDGADEAHAWSTFFAAQFPRQVSSKSKGFEKEVSVAAECADAMLRAWRERAFGPDEREPEQAEEGDAPAKSDEPAATE